MDRCAGLAYPHESAMKVRISEDVHCEQVEEEAVLVNLASGMYFGLDPVGARFWSLLAKYGSTEAATEAALEEYDVAKEQLEQDVIAFVQTLVRDGLMTVDDAPRG